VDNCVHRVPAPFSRLHSYKSIMWMEKIATLLHSYKSTMWMRKTAALYLNQIISALINIAFGFKPPKANVCRHLTCRSITIDPAALQLIYELVNELIVCTPWLKNKAF